MRGRHQNAYTMIEFKFLKQNIKVENSTVSNIFEQLFATLDENIDFLSAKINITCEIWL